MPAKQGISPSALLDYWAPCGGSKPPPYEPPTYGWARVPAKQGVSPSALLDYRAPCGGSKPPPYEPAPYGWALVHPLCWIMVELLAVGVNPHRTNPRRTDGLACPRSRVLVHPLYWLIELLAVGVNPHRTNPRRTDGPWSIRFAGLWWSSLRWEQAPTVRIRTVRMGLVPIRNHIGRPVGQILRSVPRGGYALKTPARTENLHPNGTRGWHAKPLQPIFTNY